MYPAFDWSITDYQRNHLLIEEENKLGATSERLEDIDQQIAKKRGTH